MRVLRIGMIVAALVGSFGTRNAQADCDDILYIGDQGDNTVKRFDACSGAPLDATSFVSGLDGPQGLLFDGSNSRLLVANQNIFTSGEPPISGEVLQYDATGSFLGPLVPPTRPDAPSVPQGMVLRDNVLYVADLALGNGLSPGHLLRYDATSGTLLGKTGAADISSKVLKTQEFHPRAAVFHEEDGEDLLYVSVRDLRLNRVGLGGSVLRFRPDGSFVDVFITDDGGGGQLNRPQGLVFDAAGCLYITSFRADAGDTDSIRIYDRDGQYTGKIDLDAPGADPRTYAQAILFGPSGKLFVPITNTGELRRYSVAVDPTTCELIGTPAYDTLSTGELIQPWFLTFEKTDPATLEYK